MSRLQNGLCLTDLPHLPRAYSTDYCLVAPSSEKSAVQVISGCITSSSFSTACIGQFLNWQFCWNVFLLDSAEVCLARAEAPTWPLFLHGLVWKDNRTSHMVYVFQVRGEWAIGAQDLSSEVLDVISTIPCSQGWQTFSCNDQTVL